MAGNNRAKGIDVSHYKKTIDWRKVKQSGVEFAIIKATESEHFVDPRFDYNWTRTRREGIIRGAYHFFRPKVDPVAQANHFLRVAGETLHDTDLPPVVDIEMYPDFMKHEWKSINLEERYKRIQLWLNTVESATGRIPMIYTEYYTWYELIGNTDRFSRYPLWVANYKVQQPKVPANDWGGQSWWIWQFTDRGMIPGIRDEAPCVDLNEFIGSNKDLKRWLKIESPRSVPPMITNGDMMAALINTADQLHLSAEKLTADCGFHYLVDPIGNTTRPYDGPALEELPLEEQVRDVLADFVENACGENASAWSITHQDLINAFYYAGSLEDIGGWHLVTRAGLDYIGEDRDEIYIGPVIEKLPGLTEQQKEAILVVLGLGMALDCETKPEEQDGTGSLPEDDFPEEEAEDSVQEPAVQATYGPEVDNQAIINAFYLTAIKLDRVGREMMANARLSDLVNDRLSIYIGPHVEDLPGLEEDERESIAALLGVNLDGLIVDEVLDPPAEPVAETPSDFPVEDDFSSEEIPAGPTYPGLVNQDIINLFYRAASTSGENGLHWIVRCGLGNIASSRDSRFEVYEGPVVNDLSSLTVEQRSALVEELAELSV